MEDFVVVGSGCTGAMAAATLVEGGARVLMLDAGERDDRYASVVPPADFVSARTSDPEQYRYFLGEDFEGVPWGKVGTGAQLTPPRRYLVRRVPELLPLESESFFPLESLAYGGLGAGWGLGCCAYSDAELRAVGLAPAAMRAAYQWVADRIGISGERDDASPYTIAHLERVLPTAEMDANAARLHASYLQRRRRVQALGFRMGRTALALLTRDVGERKAYAYRDMDFYDDRDQSAYRPWMTVDELRKRENFLYRKNVLVTRFEETADAVIVHGLDTVSGGAVSHGCRRLVLAPGVLGTARIVLRSFDRKPELPILCNPYSYLACIQPALLGAPARGLRIGFAQLSLFHDPAGSNFDVAMGSIYSYRSLMLFRIVRETPVALSDAYPIMRYLAPALTLVGIHHPDAGDGRRSLRLEACAASPTADVLKADFSLSDDGRRKVRDRERRFTRVLRWLGAYRIRRVDPGHGSSIHYAGTLPFDDGDSGVKPFTLRPGGRLSGSARVHVADGSGFRYLPAKGVTLSLMANARLTALGALRDA